MSAFEKHYRINDLVALWGLSRRTIIRLVDEYGAQVPKVEKHRSRFGPIKPRHVVRLVPESLVNRIYRERLMGGGLSR